MAPESVRRLRKWARRRRKPLIIGGVALVLALIAAYLIYDAVTEPVVGEGSDGSGAFGLPSPTSSLPPGATGDITDIGGGNFGLPSGGFSAGCDFSTFTMSFTSDAPVTIAGYLTSAGKQDYYPVESSGSVTVEQCPTDPSVLIIAQAGPRATTLTCTTTKSGRTVESRTARGAYGLVYCYG